VLQMPHSGINVFMHMFAATFLFFNAIEYLDLIQRYYPYEVSRAATLLLVSM
jgi:hypothetical protein